MSSAQFTLDSLTMTSVIVATRELITCDLDNEIVILDQSSGVYFGLNAVGTRVWELIQEPRSIGSLCDTLLTEYDVTPEQCISEVLALAQTLAAQHLIEVRDAEAHTPAHS